MHGHVLKTTNEEGGQGIQFFVRRSLASSGEGEYRVLKGTPAKDGGNLKLDNLMEIKLPLAVCPTSKIF